MSEQAIRECARNVIVDASAGTGKTTFIVKRILAMVAPTDGRTSIPLSRIAAITFTRKAASELRTRVRRSIREHCGDHPLLHQMLLDLERAPINTIHAFAGELLRRFPREAGISPGAELLDDPSELLLHCFEQLLSGDSLDPEALATLVNARRAGIRVHAAETDHGALAGLDTLVAGFIDHRDQPCVLPASPVLDLSRVRALGAGLIRSISGVSGSSLGGAWLLDIARVTERVLEEDDPVAIYGELVDRMRRGPRGATSDAPNAREDFGGDLNAWAAWRKFVDAREQLFEPLHRWMAVRLARLRPVVVELYEQEKRKRGVLDHLDALMRLRDLLRDRPEIRRVCQGLFDHVLVDEFQDTDPLQTEIVMYLCERGSSAKTWSEVTLTPGMLTIVGDPKQSIYRFRRADVGTYRRAVEVIERSPHIRVSLTTSWRSTPSLVAWLNERFVDVLGSSDHRLVAGRDTGTPDAVHAVHMDLPDGGSARDYRILEADVMARYLRGLVESGRAKYGEIAVLALTTTQLPTLFAAFDRECVPYAARGGTLFVSDPLHRRFLLALRAIANPADGVAEASLLRPPFFAVDFSDLCSPESEAMVAARAQVRDLRERRFERTPGQTARALLEETAFGRMIALGPNGRGRLAAIRELCFQIEVLAMDSGADFDATMRTVGTWVDQPPHLDRPHPVDEDAIRVLTVHQAKGLEFPVVALWDGRATWTQRTPRDAWLVDRGGRGWAIRIDGLNWQEPPGIDLVERERRELQEELARLVYVAATRARDLLVIPCVGVREETRVLGKLVGARQMPQVTELPLHTPVAPASWYIADAAAPNAEQSVALVPDRDDVWRTAAVAACAPALRPTTFRADASETSHEGPSRFGTVFGTVVHRAIGLALQLGLEPASAVARAARSTGGVIPLGDAEDDVRRAVEALHRVGLSGGFQIEYPVAETRDGELLVSGYADLVIGGAQIIVIDFKTDAPSTAIPPAYRDQVCGYARAIGRALSCEVRAGLLYTADGEIRWMP